MPLDRSLKTTFNEVAKLYDEVRPGYPPQLVADVISLSGILANGRILEIGCGPGKATLPFARRGYRMLCLELGKALAALAAEKCRPYANVKIETIAFEAWPLQKASFDLVISAQAFHWIDPEIGLPKVAAALKASGTMALFWNHYPLSDTAMRREIDKVYRQRAPQIAADEPLLPGIREERIERVVAEIDESGHFEEVVVRRYPWSKEYDTEGYIKLLNTYSDHRNLDEATRNSLFAGVREVITRHGGRIENPYLAVLYLARVKRA